MARAIIPQPFARVSCTPAPCALAQAFYATNHPARTVRGSGGVYALAV